MYMTLSRQPIYRHGTKTATSSTLFWAIIHLVSGSDQHRVHLLVSRMPPLTFGLNEMNDTNSMSLERTAPWTRIAIPSSGHEEFEYRNPPQSLAQVSRDSLVLRILPILKKF